MTEVRTLTPRQVDRKAWDEFCARHDASFLCLSNNFAFPFSRKVKLFEFYDPSSRERIAQCGVRISGKQIRFLDALVIDPRYRQAASTCLEEIVRHIGRPGAVFTYGSPWNMLGPMTQELRDVRGVETIAEDPYVVDAIDLRQYENPESFLKSVSSSHRRSIRKAQANAEQIRVSRFAGVACLARLRTMNRLRRATFTRKELAFGSLISLLSMAKKIACFGRRAFVTTVELNGSCFGGVFGLAHDAVCFYVHGGNLPNKLGLSHWQHWSLIRECFAAGQSFYVMGYAYERDLGSQQLEAQRTFKKRFRCGEFPGSIVKFSMSA